MASRISSSDSQAIGNPTDSSSGDVISIRVDGSLSARLRVGGDVIAREVSMEEPSVRFDISADAEWIEVSTHCAATEIPLASWFVPFDPASGVQEPFESSVSLSSGGDRLSLRVSPYRDIKGDVVRSAVEVRLCRDAP